jgi:hypothetical protein
MPSYTFPDNMRISDNAKDVITSLLVNDPGKQPLIHPFGAISSVIVLG